MFAVIPGVVVGALVTQKYGNAFGFALGNIFTAVFQALLLVVGVWMESNTTTLILWLLAFLIGYPVSLARQPISRTKTDARACA